LVENFGIGTISNIEDDIKMFMEKLQKLNKKVGLAPLFLKIIDYPHIRHKSF